MTRIKPGQFCCLHCDWKRGEIKPEQLSPFGYGVFERSVQRLA